MLRDRTFPTERPIERSVRNVQTSLVRRMQPATDTAESSPPRAIGRCPMRGSRSDGAPNAAWPRVQRSAALNAAWLPSPSVVRRSECSMAPSPNVVHRSAELCRPDGSMRPPRIATRTVRARAQTSPRHGASTFAPLRSLITNML